MPTAVRSRDKQTMMAVQCKSMPHKECILPDKGSSEQMCVTQPFGKAALRQTNHAASLRININLQASVSTG